MHGKAAKRHRKTPYGIEFVASMIYVLLCCFILERMCRSGWKLEAVECSQSKEIVQHFNISWHRHRSLHKTLIWIYARSAAVEIENSGMETACLIHHKQSRKRVKDRGSKPFKFPFTNYEKLVEWTVYEWFCAKNRNYRKNQARDRNKNWINLVMELVEFSIFIWIVDSSLQIYSHLRRTSNTKFQWQMPSDDWTIDIGHFFEYVDRNMRSRAEADCIKSTRNHQTILSEQETDIATHSKISKRLVNFYYFYIARSLEA